MSIEKEYQLFYQKFSFSGLHQSSFPSLLEHLPPLNEGAKILLVGIGLDSLALEMIKHYPSLDSVIGIDLHPRAITYQQVTHSHPKARYICGNYLGDDGRKDVFDLIIDCHCLHLFSNKEDRQAFFELTWKRLKKGGYFLIEHLSHDGATLHSPLFLDENNTLWKYDGSISETLYPFRYAPRCIEFEQEIASYFALDRFFFRSDLLISYGHDYEQSHFPLVQARGVKSS